MVVATAAAQVPAMSGDSDPQGRAAALATAVQRLRAARTAEGFWEGRLSSSALSTATAVSALSCAGQSQDRPLIRGGVAWLGRTQNQDGGWGDTSDSPSNLATTLLALAALQLAGPGPAAEEALARAESYLATRAGSTAAQRVAAIRAAYGADRTFAVPILLNCALAGLVPWSAVPGLPFELAALPASWYRRMRLHVVSYALPALIAVGLLVHARHSTRNPLLRLVRRLVAPRVLGQLGRLQPEKGGFLEATPLTSFVAMSLASLLGPAQPVVASGLEFLRASGREDGSWPIDTNLSVWVTSGALRALEAAGGISPEEAQRTREWVQRQQYRVVHPYTQAAPGGWSWTHLPGGVPDADDTAGALLILAAAGPDESVAAGVEWLLNLQNADGGWPSFCRGWGKLPFDQSCPDLTAHALRALGATAARVPGARRRLARAVERGFAYLTRTQRPDGAWIPLWFGNQAAPRHENPVVGAARVLLAYAATDPEAEQAARGVQFLLGAHNDDGGWGGAPGVPSSVEETALAVLALSYWPGAPAARAAVERGADYLVGRVEEGSWVQPSPIGLYFASLWYAEEMYPLTWTVEALARSAGTEPGSRAGVDVV
jgi:squalene-hopene/tetraprenyl-beta-curcumene cyclase